MRVAYSVDRRVDLDLGGPCAPRAASTVRPTALIDRLNPERGDAAPRARPCVAGCPVDQRRDAVGAPSRAVARPHRHIEPDPKLEVSGG
jgi:hypothetical protein